MKFRETWARVEHGTKAAGSRHHGRAARTNDAAALVSDCGLRLQRDHREAAAHANRVDCRRAHIQPSLDITPWDTKSAQPASNSFHDDKR